MHQRLSYDFFEKYYVTLIQLCLFDRLRQHRFHGDLWLIKVPKKLKSHVHILRTIISVEIIKQ